METTILNPQVVYVQATTPTDKTQGKLWYNTTDNTLYTSNGTSYVGMETDLSDLQRQQLEQNLNILINSVASSSTLNDWDDMFVDEFTDADGTSNTIDTGNTTASFEGDNAHGKALTSNANYSGFGGVKIEAKEDITITNVHKKTQVTGANAKIYAYTDGSALGSELASASWTGDDATFDLAVASGVKVYVGTITAGTSAHYRDATGTSFPLEKEQITYLSGAGSQSGFAENTMEDIESITTTPSTPSNYSNDDAGTPADLIIQTKAITCVTAQTHHQVFCHNTTTGTGAITYDISFDNGSTWDTAQSLNTKNARGGTTGTQMILKLNLNGVGDGNTASADDYGVMLFY